MAAVKPKILYFEDDPESVEDFALVLSETYDITLSVHRNVIETPRDEPFDLLILDLMIHLESADLDGKVDEGIFFPKTNWRRTGMEFLRRVRDGQYMQFGLPHKIPVIVATAVGEYSVKEEAIHCLGVSSECYLEKPFTMDTLLAAVERALMPSEESDGDGCNA